MLTEDIIIWLREHAKGVDFNWRFVMRIAANRLEQLYKEVMFTRKFIHEHGLEFELASAWDKEKEDGKLWSTAGLQQLH